MVKKSFSLIEVVISLLILGLILPGMLYIFGHGLSWTKKLKEEKNILLLTKETLEFYSLWQNLVNLTGSDPPTNGNYSLSSVTVDNTIYTRTLTINNGPSSGLKRIAVTIRGPEKTKSTITYTSKIE
ncbi:MAG: hypothetical protein DRP76_00615 [Candidatus Omnitrophota bacterium]|nr:MAG: hypothetical protein DRP76_00615 [Candidatus Omnitrophota bacterium]RLJ03582.1 MAG: hypothetical protein DRP08_03400 [Candidatus Aenigmarchaeota archaeon]